MSRFSGRWRVLCPGRLADCAERVNDRKTQMSVIRCRPAASGAITASAIGNRLSGFLWVWPRSGSRHWAGQVRTALP